jgi:hypothetical protein
MYKQLLRKQDFCSTLELQFIVQQQSKGPGVESQTILACARHLTLSESSMTSKASPFFIVTVLWVVYCLLVLTIGDYIPIEFSNSALKGVYYLIIYCSLPVSIIWLGIVFFNIEHPRRRALFSAAITGISILTLAMVWLSHSFCGDTNTIVYVNKVRQSSVIVQRSYGCGAYDSDLPKYQTYKLVPINRYLNLVTKVDIAKVDESAWIKR